VLIGKVASFVVAEDGRRSSAPSSVIEAAVTVGVDMSQ
jgi:hypothetical protein